MLNLHHLPETIASVVGDGSDLGVRVRYSWEQPEVLGTAGGPRQALPLLGAGTFLIVNGDTLTDVDVPSLVASHQGSGALVTLALVPNHQPHKYGGVVLDAESRVTGFVQAAARGARRESFHFVGVQVVEPAAFDGVAAGVPANSIGGVYDRLIAQPSRGDPRVRHQRDVLGCRNGRRLLARPRRRWRAPAADRPERRASIQPRASRRRSCGTMSRSARTRSLEECIVTDGAVVPAGARYRRADPARRSPGRIRSRRRFD